MNIKILSLITRTLIFCALLFCLASMKLFTTTAYAAPANKVGTIKARVLNVRSGPGTTHKVIGKLYKGSNVTISKTGTWHKITYKGKTAYISASYVTVKSKPAPRPSRGYNPRPKVTGDQIVEYAKKFIGTLYRYGGTSPSGFDCSGFTQYVYKHFGISLGRTTRDQIHNGTAVSKSDLEPGDLVFTHRGHVGIYVGNGNFIDSPRTGYRISIRNIWSFYAGRRIIN
jgi:cell wall-associated NlpC family hydrolase